VLDLEERKITLEKATMRLKTKIYICKYRRAMPSVFFKIGLKSLISGLNTIVPYALRNIG